MGEKRIIKTKEEFIEFLESLPQHTYTWLNECYTNQEESCYDNSGDFRNRAAVITQVWEGDIKWNMEDVDFEISNEEAIEVINEYID